MLLHNISHTDLVLGLDILEKGSNYSSKSSLDSMSLCRPRFSAFDMYCRRLLQALDNSNDNNQSSEQNDAAEIILVPQYQRSQNDPRYTIQPSGRPHVATGFCWRKSSSSSSTTATTSNNIVKETKQNSRIISLTEALAELRVRGKDMAEKVGPYIRNNKKQDEEAGCPQSPDMAGVDLQDAPVSPTGASWNMVAAASTLETPVTSNNVDKNDQRLYYNSQRAAFIPSKFDTSATTTANNNTVTAATATATPPTTITATPSTTTQNTKDEILVELKAIFFPLLATLLPRWHALIAQKYSKQNDTATTTYDYEVQKVLVLVTGVGTPRNWTHSITGNSTQALADLMELFLAKVYPDITVVKIHSDTNIFRYDDNILFVQQELMPTVNAYRDAHATQAPYPHEINMMVHNNNNMNSSGCDGDGYMRQLQPQAPDASSNTFDVNWKKSFAVTLSFADGSPARTHAIQTALRIFRPTYFHIWQLKTFWHERKIVDDDVEVHSFEEMETSPALESSELQGELAQVVEEMKAFRQEMTETLQKRNASDIHSFWLRKTHKPVLAVLLVQSEGSPPVLYRGTNMEVSMPTGSLCAERNVIGTALATNPRLKRQDLKCIAVLAVPQPPKVPQRPPRSSSQGSATDNNNIVCGSCTNSRHNSVDETSKSTMTGREMRKESFDEREEDWTMHYDTDRVTKGRIADSDVASKEERATNESKSQGHSSAPIRQISLFSSESSNSLVDMINQIPVGSGGSPAVTRGKKSTSEKRTVILRSNNQDVDLNPLSPCGACHEWLKKIAECNPYFQIMTFTDENCNGVYVTPCQE